MNREEMRLMKIWRRQENYEAIAVVVVAWLVRRSARACVALAPSEGRYSLIRKVGRRRENYCIFTGNFSISLAAENNSVGESTRVGSRRDGGRWKRERDGVL